MCLVPCSHTASSSSRPGSSSPPCWPSVPTEPATSPPRTLRGRRPAARRSRRRRIAVGDELYVISDLGVLSCVDAKTGKLHWQERIGGNHSASPIFADGRIYFLSEEGVATVIAPGKTFQKLAVNELDGATLASMAVANGSIFIRSLTHLYGSARNCRSSLRARARLALGSLSRQSASSVAAGDATSTAATRLDDVRVITARAFASEGSTLGLPRAARFPMRTRPSATVLPTEVARVRLLAAVAGGAPRLVHGRCRAELHCLRNRCFRPMTRQCATSRTKRLRCLATPSVASLAW